MISARIFFIPIFLFYSSIFPPLMGQSVTVDVGPNDLFWDVCDQVLESEKTYEIAYVNKNIVLRAKNEEWRNYQSSPTKEEKKDIAYIVKTLGFENLLIIGKETFSLKKAGKRIDHIHPLRFLAVVFTDDELKAAIRGIYDQGGWVWSGFIDGLTKSLAEENNRQNVLPFSNDFAKRIKFNHDRIHSLLEKRAWDDFVKMLIFEVPREKDPNRYNM